MEAIIEQQICTLPLSSRLGVQTMGVGAWSSTIFGLRLFWDTTLLLFYILLLACQSVRDTDIPSKLLKSTYRDFDHQLVHHI